MAIEADSPSAHSKTVGGLPLASDVFLFQYVLLDDVWAVLTSVGNNSTSIDPRILSVSGSMLHFVVKR